MLSLLRLSRLWLHGKYYKDQSIRLGKASLYTESSLSTTAVTGSSTGRSRQRQKQSCERSSHYSLALSPRVQSTQYLCQSQSATHLTSSETQNTLIILCPLPFTETVSLHHLWKAEAPHAKPTQAYNWWTSTWPGSETARTFLLGHFQKCMRLVSLYLLCILLHIKLMIIYKG